MKFFADTAEIAEIRELAATGLLDGVTTNPSLVKKSGRDFLEVVAEIAKLVPDAEFVARPRFSQLTYAGPKKITRLPPRSAIVAFSAELFVTTTVNSTFAPVSGTEVAERQTTQCATGKKPQRLRSIIYTQSQTPVTEGCHS